jgi:hypothetical protein
MQMLARTRSLFWPDIADSQSADVALQRSSKWIFVWASICVAIGLLDLVVLLLVQRPVHAEAGVATAFVWYIIAEGFIFAIIGWRVRRRSLSWAIAGLLIAVVGSIAVLPSPFAFTAYALLVLAFVNAVRAASKSRRLSFRGK